MKILFAVVSVCCVVFTMSCKKDMNNYSEISVVGSWHLISITSSLVEHTPTDSIILNFQQNGKYIEVVNGSVTAQGYYTTSTQKQDSLSLTFINYNPDLDNAPGAQVKRFNDTLILIPEVFSTDGYQLAYKTINSFFIVNF